jgi:hypothetical protein
MNLDNILYAPQAEPGKVKRELDKLFPLVEIEYRYPREPLFQFNMRCIDYQDNTVRVIAYGWSEKELKWFFEDLTEEQ